MSHGNEDHFGKIKMIDTERGFGFIYSEIDNKDYYFKLRSLPDGIKPNIEVAFKIKLERGRTLGDAIRKVYSNKAGLKFVKRVNKSHLHEVPEEYIQAAYEQILNVPDGKSVHTIKFPMPIGKSICVPTTVNDRIIYAIRQGRLGHSRFVLNRLPFDSSSLTMVLLNLATYNLVCSCFIGDKSKPEPWDKDASKEDLDFWQNHALIFNEEKIIDGSETESCPWILNEPAISYVKFNRLLPDSSSDKIH